ncbi:MAG: hypothetical protein K2N02_04250 [Alistipes sp.]|nr:hypothetical protein [Alistipes sp.]
MQTDFRKRTLALLLWTGLCCCPAAAQQPRSALPDTPQAIPSASAADTRPADSLLHKPAVEIGKGIAYRSPGGKFSLTMRLRMQDLVAVSLNRSFGLDEIEARIKRLQVRFDGYVYSPKLTYSVQLGFTGHAANARSNANIIHDAILYYRPAPAWSFGIGQAKIQASRAKITSSGLLQFVDRSIVSREFSADRDFGFFIRFDLPHDHGFTFTAKSSVTLGEGRNWGTSTNGGLVYTRRVELYPFGRFKEKGESSEGDLAHEEQVKILVAGAYSYNHKAVRTHGQRGDLLPDGASRSFGGWYADFLLKYRGFSFCTDFMGRICSDPVFDDEARTWIYAGWGFNVQAGYVIRRKWEVALRSSMLFPRSAVQSRAGYERRSQTTAAVSRYIAGHALKVQADITYNHRRHASTSYYSRWLFAFQLEIGI